MRAVQEGNICNADLPSALLSGILLASNLNFFNSGWSQA